MQLDFQDALRGPVGYDLVSLLKDCYISWSRERVERWVKGYRRVLGNLGANVGDSEYQFLRWFDLIGVQRHIKVLGIFCRLWHRDGKIGYLNDLPLTFEYVRDACRRYPELVEFERWLEWRPRGLVVLPAQPWNHGFSHPNAIRYDGSNLHEIRAALRRLCEAE